ncbi:MAG TPA: hypothetical protein VGH19_03465 [Verrucomicrobiae bacterium]
MRAAVPALALAVLPLTCLQAIVIDTFKTGVNETTGTILADNATDSNWIITSLTGGNSDGTFPRPATVTDPASGWSSALPIAGTALITRGTTVAGVYGTYTFAYQFSINTATHSGFAIGGLTWADDYIRVLLNGNEIMAMSGHIWNQPPVSFTNSNQAYFLNGLNTLTFEVLNTGGDVAMNASGVVTATPIPEAHEWAMMMLAFGIMGYFSLKRDSAQKLPSQAQTSF